MNISSMQKVNDINKRSHSPDLKYSDETGRWTMNERVQDILNLGDSHGLQMYVGVDEDTGEQVVLVEIVDSDDADFFKGKGNVFVARRLADAIDHHSFALMPVDEMNGDVYALREWEGESEIMDDMMPVSDDTENEMDDVNVDEESIEDDGQTEFAMP